MKILFKLDSGSKIKKVLKLSFYTFDQVRSKCLRFSDTPNHRLASCTLRFLRQLSSLTCNVCDVFCPKNIRGKRRSFKRVLKLPLPSWSGMEDSNKHHQNPLLLELHKHREIAEEFTQVHTSVCTWLVSNHCWYEWVPCEHSHYHNSRLAAEEFCCRKVHARSWKHRFAATNEHLAAGSTFTVS